LALSLSCLPIEKEPLSQKHLAKRTGARERGCQALV